MSKQIHVYGSLRKGDYNHDRFPDVKHIETKVMNIHAQMHDLGVYPALTVSSIKRKIAIDTIEVSDEIGELIDAMEKGAGYTTRSFNDGEEVVTLYIHSVGSQNNFVPANEEGIVDWIQHKAKRRQ